MKRNRISKKILSAILVGALLVTSGCSLFKSSKKTGDGSDSSLSESDLDGRGGNIAGAEGEGLFRDIHFDYDSFQVSGAAREDLKYNARLLKDNSGMIIQLEGHTDERGTEEYNMALGQKRADAVRTALISSGISPGNMSTTSYGENVPLVEGNRESAWSKNRRVHFSVISKGE